MHNNILLIILLVYAQTDAINGEGGMLMKTKNQPSFSC